MPGQTSGRPGFPTDLFTITGDPGSIEAAAERFGRYEATSIELKETLTRVGVPTWAGAEGELYRASVRTMTVIPPAAATSFGATRIALQTFARTMQTQQSVMRPLRDHAWIIWQRLQTAGTVTDATRSGIDASATARSTGSLEQEWRVCLTKAAAVHTVMREAAAAAARAIRAAPPPPQPRIVSPGVGADAVNSLLLNGASVARTAWRAVDSFVVAEKNAAKPVLDLGSVYSFVATPSNTLNLIRAARGAQPLPISLEGIFDRLKIWSKNAPNDLAGAMRRSADVQATILASSTFLKQGGVLPDSQAVAFDIAQARLPSVTADLKGAEQIAKVAGVAKGVARVGGHFLTGLSVVDSLNTAIHPDATGALGAADRTMAIANLAGTGMTLAAPLLAGASVVPVVGQGIALATGLYLGGRWMYDNVGWFKNGWDAGRDAVAKKAVDVREDAARVQEDVRKKADQLGDGVDKALGDAWKTAKTIF